ncbi:hypothetical protein [Deinococcus multiflagellatus]|uniref:hypothetical protein n=1 Tax=Deinococcus multiflagellatus TaxID=1656887 RepID=UPI001CCB621F|nr:hypothetical protein [Deinococcus multiflagellatus]MBZ9715264.1 hypothetical protein [Deinococcus multiflagellatus]
MQEKDFFGVLGAMLLMASDGNGGVVRVTLADLVGGGGSAPGPTPTLDTEALRATTVQVPDNDLPTALPPSFIDGVEGQGMSAVVYVQGGAIRTTCVEGYQPVQGQPFGALWPEGSIIALDTRAQLESFRALPADEGGPAVSLYVEVSGVRTAPPFGGSS